MSDALDLRTAILPLPFQCPLWVKSGHVQCTRRCLLCANSGHPLTSLDHPIGAQQKGL